MAKSKKNRKESEPSKEEAALAMEMIKALQKSNDEDTIKNKSIEEELEKQRALEEANKLQVQLAQEKVKKLLRENIRLKEEENKNKKIKNFLEYNSNQKSKIKWKSTNDGSKLEGYVENKLIFEIKKGMVLFSLYIKDKNVLKEKKLNSYQGCSMTINKLKVKSDKFI